MKTRHLTGLSKYLHLIRSAITIKLLSLPPSFIWFLIRQIRYEKPTVIGNQFFINTTYTPLKSKSYKTALKYFSNASRKIVHPLSVYVSVTNKCVFNCLYCSNFSSADEDLDGDIFCRLINQIQDSGAACIGFTGGEPLLRNDLEQIIEAVDERSYAIVFTSGHLLGKERARALKNAGLSAMVISLDSHIAKEHNSGRNSEKAFDTAVSAIQSSVSVGLYTAVSMVISKEMLFSKKIYDFISFVGKLGAHEIRILRPMPCGKLMKGNFEQVGESDLNRLRVLQYDINKNQELPTIMALPHIGSINNYGCSAGRTHAYVTADGDVCPCDFVPLSFGNITESPFNEIYKKMAVNFPKPAYGCISQMIYQDIKSVADGKLPVRDMTAIQNLILVLKNRPIPLLYKRLGYD
jgi:MoaA/NifB/PqqE/SkfB family radical SAM enzyme